MSEPKYERSKTAYVEFYVACFGIVIALAGMIALSVVWSVAGVAIAAVGLAFFVIRSRQINS